MRLKTHVLAMMLAMAGLLQSTWTSSTRCHPERSEGPQPHGKRIPSAWPEDRLRCAQNDNATDLVAVLLAMAFLLTTMTGCDWWRKTPTPAPTPAPYIPNEVLAARDAALLYLRHTYPGKGPAEGLAWTGRSTTPAESSGFSSYDFRSEQWLLTVGVPVLAPGQPLYEMELTHADSGFRWTGRLNKSYTVLESNLDVAVEVIVVRDLVLAFVREHYPQQAPVEGLLWAGERTTPEGSTSYESCRFTSNEWAMAVEYELAQPDQVIYQVELRHSGNGFVWRGQVDAQGVVLEERLPG